MQTQDDHIGLRHQSTLGFGVFALGRVYADQFDLWQQSQTFAYLQAGGTGFAINKNLSHVENSSE
jgi:hypothetical protein